MTVTPPFNLDTVSADSPQNNPRHDVQHNELKRAIDEMAAENIFYHTDVEDVYRGDGVFGEPPTAQIDGTFKFNDSVVDADPGAGKVAFDNADYSAVTEMYVSETGDKGFDLQTLYANLNGTYLYFIHSWSDATSWVSFSSNGAPVDNGSYWTFPVTFAQEGPVIDDLTNDKKCFFLLRHITPGSVGVPEDVNLSKTKTPASGDVLTFDGTDWHAAITTATNLDWSGFSFEELDSDAATELLFQGLLADRPDTGDVPLNFTYYAADVGITYCNLADGWHQAGADQILYSSMALGHAYVLEFHAGATDTYPTG